MVARAIALLFILMSLALAPGTGQAYVREVTTSGVPVAWHYPCVTMEVYLGAPPPVLSAPALFAASQQAAAVWSYPSLACTDMRLTLVEIDKATADVGHDGRNVIVFRRDTWCRQPSPVNSAGLPEPDCYSPSVLALTSYFKNTDTGEILDADIEFNAVNYSWGDLKTQPASNTVDFQNALTHELGHVIGLDHNCYEAPPRLLDGTGEPEVDCYSNPPPPLSVSEATMYPSVELTDTQRRTLTPDDEQGACAITPHLHEVCPPWPSDSGCNILVGRTSIDDHTWMGLACDSLALLAAILTFRRVRRKI